jgi:hypothetical protein
LEEVDLEFILGMLNLGFLLGHLTGYVKRQLNEMSLEFRREV